MHACSHPFPSLLPQAFHGKQHHSTVLSSSSNEKQTISRECLGFGERTLVSQVDRRSHFPGEEIFLGVQFWSGVFRWQTDAVLNRGYSNWVRSQTLDELFADMILNIGMPSTCYLFLYRPGSFPHECPWVVFFNIKKTAFAPYINCNSDPIHAIDNSIYVKRNRREKNHKVSKD